MNVFLPADILLPQTADLQKWAVIACDQFTSNAAYWDRVRANAADAPSAMHLILPEVDLNTPQEAAQLEEIKRSMQHYLEDGVFRCYSHAFIYVERTLQSGAVRKGLVGMVDLEAYDYNPGSVSPIRATEKTVVSRIPPRMRVRRNASMELPHVLMLCDDHENMLLGPVEAEKTAFPLIYDFDLMEDGGHISGWLLQGAPVDAFEARLTAYTAQLDSKYQDLPGIPMVFAVGDGNHSLATAKACYEELKTAHPDEDLSRHPARYALVELENIHDDAQVFESIHRVLFHTDPQKLLRDLAPWCAPNGYPVHWFTGTQDGTIYLDRSRSQLAVGVLQSFLDGWMQDNPGELDYIHGESELRALAGAEDAIGFLLPAMEKSQLFRGVIADGVLPRKTFSMGHAKEKRYYLEGRMIQ